MRVVVTLLMLAAACSRNDSPIGVEPYQSNGDDAVLELALASAPNTAVQITITNGSRYAWSGGLITLTPPFTVNQTASAAMSNFVNSSASGQGNPTTFATALGALVGVNAWIVPALAVGGSTTLTIALPADAKLTYVARVVGSQDDFVGFRDASVAGGNFTVVGYDLNDSRGRIATNNGTTGNPATTTPTRIVNTNPCSVPAMTTAQTLLTKDMTTTAPNSPPWPGTDGGGDFDGDWTTDGSVARVWIPSVATPKVTGLFWFVNICPLPGATLRASVDMDTRPLTQHDSVTTLVVYFFDSVGNAVKIEAGWPLHKPNLRGEVFVDVPIPEQARRIAIAPMAMIAAGETASPTFDNVRASYAPEAAVTAAVASDAFSTFDADKQPTGWTETGGDWLVDPAFNHAVLWNPAWSGGASAQTTTLSRTFPLSGGTSLRAQLFVAATYSDPTSFTRLDLEFSNGTTVTGEALQGSNYNVLRLADVPIPSGATSVTVKVNATLGSAETSSVYIDDLSVVSR